MWATRESREENSQSARCCYGPALLYILTIHVFFSSTFSTHFFLFVFDADWMVLIKMQNMLNQTEQEQIHISSIISGGQVLH